MCDCYLQCEKILFCPCICLIYFCTYTGEYCCCGYSASISHASISHASISHDKTVAVEGDTAIEDDTVVVEDDEI